MTFFGKYNIFPCSLRCLIHWMVHYSCLVYYLLSFLLLAAVQRSPKKLSRKAYKNIQAKRADGYKRPSMFNTNCKKNKIYAKQSMGSNVSEFKIYTYSYFFFRFIFTTQKIFQVLFLFYFILLYFFSIEHSGILNLNLIFVGF